MTTATHTRRPAKTHEQRDTEVAAAMTAVTDAVTAIKTSDDWKAYLRFGARFHRYSFNNVILMHIQAAERGMAPLTHIAGFKTWLSLNRGVRRGETGLRIFAPVIVKLKEGDKGYDPAIPNQTRLVGFRLTSVFDIQQTDGEPVPAAPTFTPVAGDAPEGVHEALAAYATTLGFPVRDGDTGRANGHTDPIKREVVLSHRVERAQRTAVLIHEIAHIVLGHLDADYDYTEHRGIAETEAESAAYVVGTYLEIEMGEASFGYVAGWAPDAETVLKVGQRVMVAAKKILDAIEA